MVSCLSPQSSPRAAEPPCAADAVLELGDLDHLRRPDALQHELRDAVALPDNKVRGRVVEEQDLDGAAVVGVDDPGARVDEVFGREARSRRDSAVFVFRFALAENRDTCTLEDDSLQVPSGTAMLMSVSTSTLPVAGTVVSRAA